MLLVVFPFPDVLPPPDESFSASLEIFNLALFRGNLTAQLGNLVVQFGPHSSLFVPVLPSLFLALRLLLQPAAPCSSSSLLSSSNTRRSVWTLLGCTRRCFLLTVPTKNVHDRIESSELTARPLGKCLVVFLDVLQQRIVHDLPGGDGVARGHSWSNMCNVFLKLLRCMYSRRRLARGGRLGCCAGVL